MTMKSPRRRVALLALNLASFQAAWFACILGAARGIPGVGMAAVAAAVGLQFSVSEARAADAALTVTAVALGLAWDTIMAQTGVVEYASPGPFAGWAPGWILALWALFATTLREPLRWLHGRCWLAALVGGVAGALSYASAVRLGAGRFPDPTRSLLVLAAGWAAMTPLLTEFARWLEDRRLKRGTSAR